MRDVTKEAASTIRASLSYRCARSLTMIYVIRDFALNYAAQTVVARIFYGYMEMSRDRVVFLSPGCFKHKRPNECKRFFPPNLIRMELYFRVIAVSLTVYSQQCETRITLSQN